MKNLVFLFAGDATYIFEKAFGKKSAFDLCLEWANNVKNASAVVIGTLEKCKDKVLKSVNSLDGISKSAKIIEHNFWNTRTLLQEMATECAVQKCDNVVYSSADKPFLDRNLTTQVIDCHEKYFAEYTFADGYPWGLYPEVINCGTLNILHSLSNDSQKELGNSQISNDCIFNILKTDINSFEVEAAIAPKDYRMFRFDFSCSQKRNFIACKNLFEKATFENIPFDAVSLSNLAKESAEVQHTLPSFYNVQISANMSAIPFYSPYPESFKKRFGILPTQNENKSILGMPIEKFRELVKKISDYSQSAVVGVSAWGEVLLLENFCEFVKAVLEYDNLSILIEIDGTLVTEEKIKGISCEIKSLGREFPENNVIWIISLDAFSQEMYSKIYSQGNFDAAKNSIGILTKYFSEVYPQFVRMNENEIELENFYRFWHEKNSPSKGKVIIQKYDSFCKILPDRRPADLSPVVRNVCWHIKRDMTILSDGSVPLCREEVLSQENILGNIFEDGIEKIWIKMRDDVKRQLVRDYRKKCRDCDEYYTFNF